MNEDYRRYYLRALGIQPWVLKEDTIADEQPAELRNTPEAGHVAQNTPAARKSARQALSEVLGNAEAKAASTTAVGSESSPAEAVAPELPPLHTATLGWDALQALVDNCQRCELHALRKQSVFGVGNQDADLMVIGEAPGADEDAKGEPFVGRAGQLLNKMVQAIGLQRDDIYIANILKSRPPNNRNPNEQEVAACIPYLQRQIELVKPKVILCVGKVAIANLLQTQQTVGRLRGQTHAYANTPLIVTYHPAYLLRNPIDKRKAYDDLLSVKALLDADD